MIARIAVLAGDGIGPEVTRQAVRVLKTVAARFDHDFEFREALIGGCAIDAEGDPLPSATLRACRESDAALLGAVGGPQWNDAPAGKRPEDGLLGLRKKLGLFANLRPIKPIAAAVHASPLKPELLRGVDLLVVRELTGGIYFGAKHRSETDAYDLCSYTRHEIERIVRLAATLATARRGKLTSVDKANVLETSRLWRSVAERVVRTEFKSIELEHMLVDAAAMHLLTRPASFDVVVTENMFGDILTDETSVLAGSIGLLPSASLGEGTFGVYEPIHGSAPDIAGSDVANPYAAILSAAMLLRHSLKLETEATAVESAVEAAISRGVVTGDLTKDASRAVSTAQVGDAVIDALAACASGSASRRIFSSTTTKR
jgi:3-isopropylmalate dehydrogenase